MASNLIVIDGVDSSGKQTQVEELTRRLTQRGISVKKISFPNYESESSALVKMYLSGKLGDNPDAIDPYAVSTFYAADRYLSYMMDWKKDLEAGTVIIADRYVSSNQIHQAAKIKDPDEKQKFLDWLDDFEYEIYKLPRPTVQIFLDMPVKYGAMLMANRNNKFTGDSKKDIHEGNLDYLVESYNNAMDIAQKYKWDIVTCVKDNRIRSIMDVADEIFSLVTSRLEV